MHAQSGTTRRTHRCKAVSVGALGLKIVLHVLAHVLRVLGTLVRICVLIGVVSVVRTHQSLYELPGAGISRVVVAVITAASDQKNCAKETHCSSSTHAVMTAGISPTVAESDK